MGSHSRRSGKESENLKKSKSIEAVMGLLKMKSVRETGTPKTQHRTQRSEYQKSVLREVYKITRFPSRETREDLALLLNNTERNIQIWFQNQRNHYDLGRKSHGAGADEADIKARKTVDIFTLMRIIERYMPVAKQKEWNSMLTE
ncbi:hypothetical protein ENBRE01_1804 [Enteropsectra breve]|nr:hypothetical protein ENBRE01_1804 [Enteropsectra breve]